MANTNIGLDSIGKPAPKWFRKFKKIWTNTENASIVILLAMGYSSESLLILGIKTGTSWFLENLETILSNGEEYIKTDELNELKNNN